ncbi:MAG: DUF2075 domain-containing protein [Bacillota bacterium]|nr:DUF2075 domain-containing protein [Bacillota bacterium]
MLVYHQEKSKFLDDVLSGEIADIIKAKLSECGFSGGSPSEYASWDNSMHFMSSILYDPRIPDEADISIEYGIPLTSKRVDFIITGSDADNHDNVVIIELKQWTTCQKVSDIEKHTVRAFVGGDQRDVPHPCYQAYSYKVHICNYAEAASDPNLFIYPTAYCHNFKEEDRQIIEDPIYSTWLKMAPLFLKKDAKKLADFIAGKICKKSPHGDLLYEIDHGRIKPAKALQDCLASLMKGNKDFQLMDEQITIYDKCLKAYTECEKDKQKRVLIIEGGPGTGKSVLAVNLLYEFTSGKRCNPGLAAYLTKNSAPRKSYLKLLAGADIEANVKVSELFRSPFGLSNLPNDFYDVLLIDEAHRLVSKMYGDWNGENQIKECIEASRLSIFFIDDSQRISTKDIGSVDSIIDWAIKLGVSPQNIHYGNGYKLSAQFRCNGSDAYINFIDNLLGIQQTANTSLNDLEFDFRVYDDPSTMREELRKRNGNNKARMVAGYCYDWNVKNKKGDWDIIIGPSFKAKWNLDGKSELWAIRSDSFDEVGCIHTCQGLEFDYVGVIIGKDLLYRDGRVMTNRAAVSKDDKSSGIAHCKDEKLADQLLKNTYKVLLSRGQKGCYVYAEDEALRNYLKKMIGQGE